MRVARHQSAPLITITPSVQRLPWCSQDTWASGCAETCTLIISGFLPPNTRYFHILIKGAMRMFDSVSRQTGCSGLRMPLPPLRLCSWSVNGLPLLPRPFFSFPSFYFLPPPDTSVTLINMSFILCTHSSSIRRHKSQKATSFSSVDAKTRWVAWKSIQKATLCNIYDCRPLL